MVQEVIHVCSFKKSNRNSTSIQKLIVSGNEITEVQDIAEELNKYFSNVGQNLVKELFKNNPIIQGTATRPIVFLQLKIACFANQSPKMS